jgi:hypothetical protein
MVTANSKTENAGSRADHEGGNGCAEVQNWWASVGGKALGESTGVHKPGLGVESAREFSRGAGHFAPVRHRTEDRFVSDMEAALCVALGHCFLQGQLS